MFKMRNLLQLCSCKQASAEKHPISSILTGESLMILNMAPSKLACSAHLLGDTQPSSCSMVVLMVSTYSPAPFWQSCSSARLRWGH